MPTASMDVATNRQAFRFENRITKRHANDKTIETTAIIKVGSILSPLIVCGRTDPYLPPSVVF
jgi:hypothetical protein